ncbi:MAG: succinate dehydrogenase, hydrophobic membrane anchor protein [Woeseiaceae bacterium]|nr:succinate dehydrogenase, hydrophobic membrane anchor protein [Woeseiaceae bacterium]
MSLRTPLGRVLGLGSAKDGTAHFIAQRVTAIANVLLGLWFAWSLLTIDSMAYLDVMRFVASPLNGVLLSLLVINVSYHSYLGVQVVIEDYVHAHGAKLLALIASRFAHVFLAIASLYAILRIGFTA